ncbi:RES family NAD+ phosphorylase [Undibacterium sp. GrIS 1.2]|uniref:RES family NAD+ phosphorylase n=1 Tax=Undibacterium sp. GrIS 1.2 TaxID=3143933 RepID=UPI0033970E38
MQWPTTSINWHPGYRIVPSRFPSIYLFDRVADADDFDALYELEAMTNPRIRNELGEISLVPPAERLYGHGTGPIMAAFTHLNPEGSRFSDGSYGVFYAAMEKDTAVAETKHHSTKFMQATNEEPMYLQMRLYHMDISGTVTDLFKAKDSHPEIFSLASYSSSKLVGKQIHESGSSGIHYPSVRRLDGTCVAAFKTAILRKCNHAAYLEYHWDGKEINYVTEKID